MYQFKQLEWLPYQDDELNGVYAKPSGLQWSYSILVDENNHVILSMLDSHYDCDPYSPLLCRSIDEAKEKANMHYLD